MFKILYENGKKTKKLEKSFWVTKRGRFLRLQIGARGITNRGSLGNFKSVQKDCKSGQGLQIRRETFQIGAVIANRGKRDYKSGRDYKSVQNIFIANLMDKNY